MSDTAIGSRAEGYLLEFQDEAVFLTVYPPETNQSTFTDVTLLCAILKKHNIKKYKIADLLKIIELHDGTRQQISGAGVAAVEEVEEKSYVPIIEVSKDKMKAVIYFEGPEELFDFDKAYIMKQLADMNISYGINEKAIEEYLKYSNQRIVIAQGKQPINGENAYIKKYIDFSQKGRPSEQQYGKVDYKDLNLFVLVSKGDILAERILQTKGEVGMNIMGQEIACRPGKPIPLLKGKNTDILNDNTLIAMLDGQAIDENNKISVDPRLDINSDVDYATGNIDFNGSVFIRGNVQEGFTVKAQGDVEVGGTITGGVVEARNVYVNGGILGMRHGKVYAREDIRTTFVENADITAERDIFISDVALHSVINAGRRINVNEKRGQIVGGYVVAGMLIDAKLIGNAINVATRVEVGINPIISKKYKTLAGKIEAAKKKLKTIKSTLVVFEAKMDRLTLDQKMKFAEMKRMQFPLAGEIERNENELKSIGEQLKSMENAKIKVADKIYPGVKLVISSLLYAVQIEAQHCTFSADRENGCVKNGPY